MPTQWSPTPAQSAAMTLTGRDILVSAAAGSGKTATLTERIIRLLTEARPDGTHAGDISRMLIVTFTRAAAAELRARLSAALSAAIAAHPEDRYLYRQLVALGNAHICTIDAFYLEPVRAHFEQLGLPSAFRLADEYELTPLKEQTLRRLIADAYDRAAVASAPAGQPLDALRDNRFAEALDNLMPNRDRGELPSVLLSLYEKLLTYPAGVELLRTASERLRKEAEIPLAESEMGQALMHDITERLSALGSAMSRACGKLQEHPVLCERYLPAFAQDLDTLHHLCNAVEVGDLAGAREILNTYKPASLKAIPRGTELPADTEHHKQTRAAVKETLAALRECTLFGDEDAVHASMRRTADTERILYDLLTAYDAAIGEEKLRRGMLDFSDIRRCMYRLLVDRDGNVTDIARTLADSFDAVYIDEYQDVDAVQDAIFAILGAGGKRFMVGDIKQSIYSFRGAEPSVFTHYRDTFPPYDRAQETDTGVCVYMSENFRCDRSVIDFTNAVCAPLFRACGDRLNYRAEDDLVCAKADADAHPHPVRVVLLEKPQETDVTESAEAPEQAGTAEKPGTAEGVGTVEQAPAAPRARSARTLSPEALWIAGEIHRLLCEEPGEGETRPRPGDIAVLLRSMTMAGDLATALRAYGIDTTYTAKEDLSSHPDTILLYNLLCVIDNPRDDVPLMGLISAEASPFTLADILTVRAAISPGLPLYDALCAAAQGAPLPEETSPDLVSRARAFLSDLERFRAMATTLPADRLLRKLYSEPFLADKATTPPLLALYDMARRCQSGTYCGLYQFVTYLRTMMEGDRAFSAAKLHAGGDAVQILSIHKSKGLEFPIVFVAGCGQRFNRDDLSAPVLFDPALGIATKLYRDETASLEETLPREVIAGRLGREQLREEMRILYVALTRARERLYVTAKMSSTAQRALDRAAGGDPGDPNRFFSMGNDIDWILSALAEDVRPAAERRWGVEVHPLPDGLQEQPDAAARGNDALTGTEATLQPDVQDFCRRVLTEHHAYTDPRALLRKLPTKAAASKLHGITLEDVQSGSLRFDDGEGDEGLADAFLSEEEQSPDQLRRRIELMRAATPAFDTLLETRRSAGAAERGTAMHLFLQYCDYCRLARTGVPQEIETLIADRFLTRHTAEILNRDQLERFLESDLFALILRADRTYRELHFDRFLPYERLTRDAALARALRGYSLYVQGSLDLLLEMPDGALILCDYKTNRARAADGDVDSDRFQARLEQEHTDQLRLYSDAVLGLFGRRPDRVLIYSTPLGKTFDLTDAALKKS